MHNENKLLTFIIPAYNVERYIRECLDSLLHQTVMDHKVIVVNDGSTDATGVIAKDYAEKYPDLFSYYEQENQGQGAARNLGLNLLNTPYVTFLDSDDWQDCHFVERLTQELSYHDEPVDIVFTLPWVYDTQTHENLEWRDRDLLLQLFYPNSGYESVASAVLTKADPRWMEMYSLEASACRRVFRTQFLKEINYRFPVHTKWEDVAPHFTSIHHAQRCIALKSSGFCYRINTAGQTTSGSSASRLNVGPVFANVFKIAEEEGLDKAEIAYILKCFRTFTDWTVTVTDQVYILPVLESLHNVYRTVSKRYIKEYRHLFHVGMRDRIVIFLLRSPYYALLKDYRIRRIGLRIFERIKRRIKG